MASPSNLAWLVCFGSGQVAETTEGSDD